MVRGWNDKENKLVYFNLNNIQNYLEDLTICTLNGEPFERYSGLLDMKSKRIYEGDILKTNIDVIPLLIVRYGECYEVMDNHDGFYGWYLESTGCEKKSYCHLNTTVHISSYVIGNIRENKELL